MKDLLDKLRREHRSGEVVAVVRADSGLPCKVFHAEVRGWVRSGGPEGFTLLKPHQESETAEMLYDAALLIVD